MTLPRLPTLPTLPSLPTPPWEAVTPTTIPGIAGGMVTSTVKGWNRVEYSDIISGRKTTFRIKPFVVALAEVRFGTILEVPYRIIPNLPLVVYRCKKDVGWWILSSQCGWMKIAVNPDFVPDWFQKYIPEVLKPPTQCPKGHGPENIERTEDFATAIQGFSIYYTRELIDWKFGFYVGTLWIGLDLNWIRDALLKVLCLSYYGMGQSLGYIASQLGVLMTMIQATVNAGLLDVLPTFWRTTGLPLDQMITPVNVRNVTETSFEYYALSEGQRTHYVAVGVP